MKKEINKNYLKEQQYKTTKYLEARIKIHTFTENKKSFHQWLYEKYNFNNKLKDNLKILDVACGTGVFWKQNSEEAKNLNYDLIMTDFAESMLDKSKKNLSDAGIEAKFEIADVENLSKYKSQFDIILCHNAVYHAEDKKLALQNLKDCMSDDKNSIVGLTTNSEKHMLNVYEIGRKLDKNFPTDRIIDSWTEEVADKMLPEFFEYEKIIEEEKLKVTDLDILMNYVASGVEPRNIKLKESFYDEYREIVKKEIDENGFFQIIKRSPLYICKNK